MAWLPRLDAGFWTTREFAGELDGGVEEGGGSGGGGVGLSFSPVAFRRRPSPTSTAS